MAKRGGEDKAKAEWAALEQALADPQSPAARDALKKALRSAKARWVAKAAKVIRDRALEGYAAELVAAYERFLANPVKSDPGCAAKLAALEALDYLETTDPAPFIRALRYRQPEPAWGKPVDTASGVRARAAFALARLGHADFHLWMAELLHDGEPPVRLAAAEALAHRGESAGAALAHFKLRAGDDDPAVTLACIGAVLALAPEFGREALAPKLESADADERELFALAFGQSRRDEMLTALLEAHGRVPLSKDRAGLLRGIALHRSERAASFLLEQVERGAPADARSAIEALVVRAFEPGLVERVRAAASRNAKAELGEALHRAFDPKR